jgi:proteasome alpha subunit
VTLPFYASAEQVMRDRSEYARKGIARGRSVVVLTYTDGVLFVAENPSTTLHKVGEIYDRIGFAAVGRYSEYENLRTAGIRFADYRGYQNDRRDVTVRALANAFAQALGAIFTEQQHKPYEVEICVAEVGDTTDEDQMFRLTYDGSINDEPEFVVMGGQTEPIIASLRESFERDLALAEGVRIAVRALGTVGGDNGAPRTLAASQLEVAVLDRRRPTRKFRRITRAALSGLLDGGGAPPAEAVVETPTEKPAEGAPEPTPPTMDEANPPEEVQPSGGEPSVGPSAAGEGNRAEPNAGNSTEAGDAP